MEKLFYFIMICAYLLASIGGFGYAAWGGSWPIAISIVLLAVMAWPKFINYFKKLGE